MVTTFLHMYFSSYKHHLLFGMGFPGGSDSKESVCNAGYLGLMPGLGRYPGEGNGNPRQYSCLENSMNRGLGELLSITL